MGKSTFFTGQPVLAQLLDFVPASMIHQLAAEYGANRYYKKFMATDHLVSMLYCAFNQCTSLRELTTGLQANSHRLRHLGFHCTPRRSTLGDANSKRPSEFFEAIFHHLVNKHYGSLPDSQKSIRLYDRLFIVDSTTIPMFCDVMKAAGWYRSGKKKGGVKAHTLMRFKDQVPDYVHLTESAVNDRVLMPRLSLPANSIVVMDRAYVNHKIMQEWTDDNITWVTRLNKAAHYSVVTQNEISDYHYTQGIRSDERIMLGNPQTQSVRPIQEARLIRLDDQQKNKTLTFLTNNQHFSPLTIAKIYQQRWSIEILFKRLKHNFQFHSFLGDNENAIKIQVWCTLIADLLIAIVKSKIDKQRKVKWSFSNIAALIRLHLTTYIDLFKFLLDPEKAIIQYASEVKSNCPISCPCLPPSPFEFKMLSKTHLKTLFCKKSLSCRIFPGQQ